MLVYFVPIMIKIKYLKQEITNRNKTNLYINYQTSFYQTRNSDQIRTPIITASMNNMLFMILVWINIIKIYITQIGLIKNEENLNFINNIAIRFLNNQ